MDKNHPNYKKHINARQKHFASIKPDKEKILEFHYKGLNLFKNTLQTLVNHVDLVIAEKTLFDLASLLGPEALNNQDIKDRIIYFNSVLKKNVFNCRKIITLLNTVPR